MENHIDDIFVSMDLDQDNLINKEEFVEHYSRQLINLEDDIKELEERIVDSKIRAEQIEKKLSEIERTEDSST